MTKTEKIDQLYKVEAKARLDLQRQIEKELEEEDPDLETAKAILGQRDDSRTS